MQVPALLDLLHLEHQHPGHDEEHADPDDELDVEKRDLDEVPYFLHVIEAKTCPRGLQGLKQFPSILIPRQFDLDAFRLRGDVFASNLFGLIPEYSGLVVPKHLQGRSNVKLAQTC